MAPNNDADIIWQGNIERCKQISLLNDYLGRNLRLILTSLAEAYNNVSYCTVRRQILSIMAKDGSLSIIRMFIPGLTGSRFNAARQHADFIGKRVIVDDTRTPAIRYEDCQLEHFIEFIVSPHTYIHRLALW